MADEEEIQAFLLTPLVRYRYHTACAALSPVLASLSGKKKRQKILADLTPPRGKPSENICQKSWSAVE
jgi:hypothetical protein